MEFSLLNLLLVLIAAWTAGLIATRLGYPSVLGELVAGTILGPPLLGLLEGGEALAVLAEVGILLMMVYIGMEIDPKELGRASKAGLLAALGGFITPFVLCYLAIVLSGGSQMAGVFVGIAAGVTSLATKSRILVDLQLLDTRIAHVMMAGALIADTLSLILFAAVIGLGEANEINAAGLAVIAGKALLFFAVTMVLGLKLFPAIGRMLRKVKSFERTTYFTLVLLVALVFAEMAELAGMHGILGAFLAGLFLREGALGRSMSKELMHVVRDASIGFLAPIFFVTAGFAVSLDIFTTDLGLLVLVVGLATVGKIAGTALFYLPTGHGWREGLTVGAGMNGRGAVEIIVAQIGLSMGLIDQNIFSILVFMAIFTTATVPIFLKWGTRWLRSRGELVRSDEERQGVVIIGAGPTARMLGKTLSQAHAVRLVDSNKEHCAFAAADGLETIEGSAIDEQVLSDAQASHAQYFIALTPNDEVNALSAQMARTTFYVPNVIITSDTLNEGHEVLLSHINGSTLFGDAVSLEDWDHDISHDRVGHEQIRQTQLQVDQDIKSETFFKRIQAESESLPLAVKRDEQLIPYHSNLDLKTGDSVVLLQKVESLPGQLDRFDLLAAKCPILDLEHAVSKEAFFEMVASLLAPRLNLDPEALEKRLNDREQLHTSVLMPGMAIPHVKIEGHGKFDMLVARCREGIAFDEDPGGVHMLFVLISSQDERTFHLRTLSAIAQISQRDAFEQDWMQATDTETLRKLILHADRRRMVRPNPENMHERPLPSDMVQ